EAFEQFTSACQQAGIPHRTDQETGDEFELLSSLARYHDLVMLGLSGIFEFGLLPEPHNALAKLVSAGVRPILSIGEAHQAVDRILISYSGSIESAKAMKRYVQVGLWPDAKLRIVVFQGAHEDPNQLLEDAA